MKFTSKVRGSAAGLMAAVMMLIAAGGCAAKARHVGVVVDTALYEAISDIHGTEQTMLCGAPSCANRPDKPVTGWDHAKSVAFNKKLLPAAEAGRQLNIRLATWQAGQPVPGEVTQLINGLSDSLGAVIQDFPAGADRDKLLAQIANVQKMALAVLSSVLTVVGAAK